MAENGESKVVDVTSTAQFDELLKAAKGKVVVDLVQPDCGACEDERPQVEKLAARCADTTVIRVDVQQHPEIAERLDQLSPDKDWGGTPTMLLAESGEALLKGEVEEVEPGKALNRKLKCSR